MRANDYVTLYSTKLYYKKEKKMAEKCFLLDFLLLFTLSIIMLIHNYLSHHDCVEQSTCEATKIQWTNDYVCP